MKGNIITCQRFKIIAHNTIALNAYLLLFYAGTIVEGVLFTSAVLDIVEGYFPEIAE